MKRTKMQAPIDAEAEAYASLLQKQMAMKKYDMQTARIWNKKLLAEQFQDSDAKPLDQVLTEQASIIAERPLNAQAEVDIVKTLPYDVEKLTLLKNFVKMGMSNTQAQQLFDSIESRGGYSFRQNGLWFLTGHWAKLKTELLERFANGSSVALISQYIVESFLPDFHVSRTQTEDRLVDEAQAAAVALGDKSIRKRETRLEAVKTAAEKIKAGMYTPMPVEETKDEPIAATPVAPKKKRTKLPAKATPIPEGVQETAEGLLAGLNSVKKARAIIRTYVIENAEVISRSDARNLFFKNDGTQKNLKVQTMKEATDVLNTAIRSARDTQKVAANLGDEFDEAHAVGKGLKFRLDKNALNRGILSVRYNSSRLYKIKNTPISEAVQHIISNLHGGGVLDNMLYKRITPEEQRHVELYAHTMGIAGKHKITDKASRDLYERYQILLGEINSGNNNARLKRELRDVIAGLVDIGRIPYNKAMLTLAQLGI